MAAPTRFQRLATPVVGGLLAVLAAATLVTGTGIETNAEAFQWGALGITGALWLATALWRDDPEAWSLAFGVGLVFGGLGYAAPGVGATLGGTASGVWTFVQIAVGVGILVWGARYATLGLGRMEPSDGDGEVGGGGDGGGS